MNFWNLGSRNLTASLGTTAEIDFREARSGVILIPDGSAITQLTFFCAPEPGGTFEPAVDIGANAVVLTVAANQAVPIPLGFGAAGLLTSLVGCGAFKMVADNPGSVEVCLKG